MMSKDSLPARHSRRAAPFIIVTGPGRCGTSAVARVLHESGLSMGRDLGPPSEFNELGFYEELPVREVNERIFADCGVEKASVWPERSDVLRAAAAYAAQMDELAASSSVAGWKDPRFCLTLEAWLPHFAVPPRVVVCVRGLEGFVASVISIFGLFPRDLLERWWANHLRRILDFIREYGLESTSVAYEDLVQRPEETVTRLSSFVGRPLDAAHVEPALQHYAPEAPQEHVALYNEVRALSYGD